MVLTLFVKKRESKDGKTKFNSYTAKRGEVWYRVKFVKDCPPPVAVEVADGVRRAWIELDDKSKFDIATERDGAKVVYVESYTGLPDEARNKFAESERARIMDFRAKREKEKRDFLMPVDDEEDIPF